MRYNPTPTPVPQGFRDTFVAMGWKATERRYGASNATLMQWIAACGGPALLAERAACQPCGRRAGVRA